MFRGYQGDFHSPPVSVPVYRLANTQECPGDQGPSPGGPMVIVHVLTGLFTKHGPWQRMLMWCCQDDAATPVRCCSGGDTNNDPDLGDESQGWSVSVSPDPRAMAIVCLCAGVRTVGERKRKYCFWLGLGCLAGMDWAGGHFSKSSSFWILGSMKGKWRVMKSYR